MRIDIQALRGYAILSVLLFHARLSFLPGGYLGVDIFFVISGFLITNLISKQIQDGTFSFREFYFRRAKRLLPAAYTTFILTALAATFLLTSQELVDFSRQLIGAVTFTANMVLWRQGTYFGVESDLKPLLHIWSLSIEEQYYFLLPAVLVFTPKKYWFQLIISSLVLSLVICFVFYQIQAGAAFYLFPARAWELCIGSLGVFFFRNDTVIKISRFLFVPAIVTIIYVTVNPFGGIHPGIDSLLACVGTLIIILSNSQQLFSNLLGRILCWLGDMSYSLYLVHWPIFAFVNNVWLDDAPVPLMVRILCIAISIILGYLQYKFIEYPIHKASFKFSKKFAIFGAITSASLVFIALIVPYNDAKLNTEFMNARRGNTGLGQSCTFKADFSALPECETTATPDIMIWGDSNAMHLVPGIDATKGEHSIIQATKYVCGPLLGVAPVGVFTASAQTVRWAQSCLDFNNSVIAYLAKNDSIKAVILSSYFSQYLTPNKFALALENEDQADRTEAKHIELANLAMKKTIRQIRELGKRVVIVAPPPAMDFDVGRCIERNLRDLPIYGGHKDCSPRRSEVEEKRAAVYRLLSDVSSTNDISVIKFNDALDVDGKIIPSINNQNIFITNAHLSYSGSIYLAKKMNLIDQVLQFAR